MLTIFLILLIWTQKEVFRHLTKLGMLGLFFINLLSSASIFFPLPGVATVFLGGALWSPVLVGVVSGLGAALGELSGYFVGFGGRGIIGTLDYKKNWVIRIEGFFTQNGFVTTLIVALLPLPFFDFIGILAGTINYPMWKFFLATFLGRSIRDFIIAWTGARILPL